MKPLAIAALCASLAAAPLAARAADLVLFDATGRPVAVLVPSAEPVAMPGFPAGLFAEQDAVLDRMMNSMHAMEAAFARGGAMPLDPAALGGAQPGSAVVMTSFSDGHNTCSRTVTYQQRGSDAPLVQVSQTGDACSALPAAPRGGTVPVAAPEEVAPAPALNPNSPQLIRVDYRHPVAKPTAHRS